MSTKQIHINRKLTALNEKSSFGYVEAFKSLRTNINHLLRESNKGHVLMVTSSMPGEGKSNVSVNLCITLAQDNKRVILLDCDLRKGTLHRYLNVSMRSMGLSSVLSGEAQPDEAIMRLNLGFDFLPVGALPTNPSELIGSTAMNQLLNLLAENYDYVICDTAPVNAVADTSAMCRFVDGTIFVVAHNETTRNTALAAKSQLEAADANILGVVLNKYDAKQTGTAETNYYSYYNYSNYGYGDDGNSRSKG